MKTSTKTAALGAMSLAFSLALLGCEDNDKTALKNAEGGATVRGAAPSDAPKGSAAAYEQQKKNDQLNSPEYKKAMGGK